MKAEAKFAFDKVRYDQDNEVHLVVSLKAPKTNWENERPPVCVFPVIDISGSMGGSRLDYAKKSAMKLVDHLSSNDYAGLAVFENEPKLISEPLKMTSENKNILKNRIGDLVTAGGTNFSGGLLMGLNQVNNLDVAESVLKRIIMLTDGHANMGVATTSEALVALLKSNIGKSSVSCFGYGDGANQELLADLGNVGKGNYAFVQNPDDALGAFAKELGGLLSTYAQNVEVELLANSDHEIIEVISDVNCDGDKKRKVIKAPELLSEEEFNIVLRVKLAKQSKIFPRKLSPVNVKVTYDTLSKENTLVKQLMNLKAQIRFVHSGKEQTSPDKDLDKMIANAELVKAQNNAEKLATAGDFKGAQIFLANLAGDFSSRGLHGHAMYVNNVSGSMSDAFTYSSTSSYRTSGKAAIRRTVGTSALHSDAAKDLSFIADSSALSNSAQEDMVKSFVAGEPSEIKTNK